MLTFMSNTVRYEQFRDGLRSSWVIGSDPLILCRFAVVKNPLSPAEHPGGLGVDNELFEESLEQFVVR